MYEIKLICVFGLVVYLYFGWVIILLVLFNNFRFNYVLYEYNIIILIVVENVLYVWYVNCIEKVDFGRFIDGIIYIVCYVGFIDFQDVFKVLVLVVVKCFWFKDYFDEVIYYFFLVDVKWDEL